MTNEEAGTRADQVDDLYQEFAAVRMQLDLVLGEYLSADEARQRTATARDRALLGMRQAGQLMHELRGTGQAQALSQDQINQIMQQSKGSTDARRIRIESGDSEQVDTA